MAWQVDSMTKLFQDSPVEAVASPEPRPVDAARNESVSLQFAIRPPHDLAGLRCQAGTLRGPGGASLPAPQVRFVGYVPVKKNTDDSALRMAPAEFPDPLLEAAPEIAAGSVQPVWVTVAVPKDAAPGSYSGKIELSGSSYSDELAVRLTVHGCVLSDRRTLKIANWLLFQPSMEKLYGFPCNFSEERFWELLGAYARNMAKHRQNVILTPMTELVAVEAGAGGRLVFDFSRFDRWVNLFTQAGVIAPPHEGILEGSHLAHAQYAAVNHTSKIWKVQDGKAVTETVGSWSEAHQGYLSAYLPALQAHLEQKGWLAAYRQHVFDEPVEANRSYYLQLVQTLRRAAPKLRTVEATHCADLAGSVDTWVPQTDMLAKKFDFYKERTKAGDELWFYICLNPRKPHMNRFIDYPLLKTRLLHWANFKYGVDGFLHWGWNCWRDAPFKNVENDHEPMPLPPGDTHLVYPKPGGVLDSMRSEAMLEGIQDYELLQTLAATQPDQARSSCDTVIRDWTDYTLDVNAFRAARRQLLEALSRRDHT
ncbi:MAG: DUF4091 domain-containing protein [Planctomycetes bacterium]|nr:DUF4091 domain-containing protein [Planctomycetota bacterium]